CCSTGLSYCPALSLSSSRPSAERRYIHSFPTRRSSDLAAPRTTRGRSVRSVPWVVWVTPGAETRSGGGAPRGGRGRLRGPGRAQDRKSTRLNSSHGSISYAVFCLKKKNRNRLAETMLSL